MDDKGRAGDRWFAREDREEWVYGFGEDGIGRIMGVRILFKIGNDNAMLNFYYYEILISKNW